MAQLGKRKALHLQDPRPTKKVKCRTCDKKVQFVPKTKWPITTLVETELSLPKDCWRQILFILADGRECSEEQDDKRRIGGNGRHPNPACWHLALVCKEFYVSLAKEYVFPKRVNDYWAMHGNIKMTEFVMDAHQWGAGFHPTPEAAILHFGVTYGHIEFVKHFLHKGYVPGPKVYYTAMLNDKLEHKGAIMVALCRAFRKGQHDPRIGVPDLKKLVKTHEEQNHSVKVLDIFCTAINA